MSSKKGIEKTGAHLKHKNDEPPKDVEGVLMVDN